MTAAVVVVAGIVVIFALQGIAHLLANIDVDNTPKRRRPSNPQAGPSAAKGIGVERQPSGSNGLTAEAGNRTTPAVLPRSPQTSTGVGHPRQPAPVDPHSLVAEYFARAQTPAGAVDSTSPSAALAGLQRRQLVIHDW